MRTPTQNITPLHKENVHVRDANPCVVCVCEKKKKREERRSHKYGL